MVLEYLGILENKLDLTAPGSLFKRRGQPESFLQQKPA
jgi:hypothetical protein